MEKSAKKSLFRELIHRRVFQIIGLYFGAIFAVMEFTDLMVEQYSLSDVTIDVVLAGMVSFLPAVIVLAWGFGAPGRDEWGKAEKITLPLNAFVTVALVGGLIYSQDVESVVETVESSDDKGQLIVREIPKLKYINRVKIFFFDADESVSQNNTWLSYGLPIMLESELSQNPFISAGTLYNRSGNTILWRVQRAGFQDGLNVPVALAKNLAKESNADFFIMSDLSQTDDKLALDVDVYNAKNGQLVSSNSIQANKAYDLVYEMSALIKENIEVQSVGEQLTTYLNAEERLSSNLDSFDAFVDGINHLVLNNEYDEAAADLHKALSLDPSFVVAQIHLAQIYSEQGKFEEALANAQGAMNYSYKLTESQSFQLRGINYALSGNRAEERRVYEVWNKLHPTSVDAKNALANHYMWSGNEVELAVNKLLESLTIDPNQNWIYVRLGSLYEILGQLDESQGYYAQFAKRDPNSYIPHLALARIARKKGDLEGSREHILTAMYQRADMVTPVTQMANLALREGKLEEAVQRQNEADIIARAPNQQTSVLLHKIEFFTQKGQMNAAYDTLLVLRENMAEYANPIDTLINTKLGHMHLYTAVGREKQAREELDQHKNTIQAPFDKIISVGYLFHFLSLADAESAQIHYEQINALMRAQKMQHLFHILYFGEGLLAYVKQDYTSAIAKLKEAKLSFSQSVNSVNEDNIIDSVNYHLVRSLRLNGQLEEAQETAKDLLKQWPYHAMINLELAHIQVALGQKEQAKQALEKALFIWQDADKDFAFKQEAQNLLQASHLK